MLIANIFGLSFQVGFFPSQCVEVIGDKTDGQNTLPGTGTSLHMSPGKIICFRAERARVTRVFPRHFFPACVLLDSRRSHYQVVLAREAASFWRENVMIVVILIRV